MDTASLKAELQTELMAALDDRIKASLHFCHLNRREPLLILSNRALVSATMFFSSF